MSEGIFFFFQENQNLLLADPASDIWKAYVDYLDEIVMDGFFSAIECSLKYLLENTGECWFLPSGRDGCFSLTTGGFCSVLSLMPRDFSSPWLSAAPLGSAGGASRQAE